MELTFDYGSREFVLTIKSAPTHAAVAIFSWQDQSIFGRRTKQYGVKIQWLEQLSDWLSR